MPDPSIRLVTVSVSYGETVALHPSSLDFYPGTTTCLIGPSGCGKSTILRLITGLVEPEDGSVFIAGSHLTRENVLTIRRRMGYVIQEGGLFPHLTAGDNVTLMARELKMVKSAQQDRLEKLCELTRFPAGGLRRYPAELSGGQRQRVSLMRALMLRPEVLLLDEPLGALDPMVRSSLQTDLKRIFGRLGQTVIMVSHDLAEAAYLADRIVLMNEGRVIQDGPYQQLKDNPGSPFVTEFLQAQRRLVVL